MQRLGEAGPFLRIVLVFSFVHLCTLVKEPRNVASQAPKKFSRNAQEEHEPYGAAYAGFDAHCPWTAGAHRVQSSHPQCGVHAGGPQERVIL